MKQEVLENSQEVSYNIIRQIESAQQEILVAVTYFTSKNIFEKLIEKAKQGVRITVVLDDNKKNRKLDFEKLEIHHSAEIIKKKIDSSDVGQKRFCVFDKKVLIFGTFEWKENPEEDESATITNEFGTVHSYLKTFYKSIGREEEIEKLEKENKKKWFRRIWMKLLNKNQPNNDSNSNEVDTDLDEEIDAKQQTLTKKKIERKYDIDEILNSIISTEIKKFDRNELNEKGYEGAKKVNGDASVLEKTMDTLYHLFISDKNNIEDRKKSLKQKIKDKVADLTEDVSSAFLKKKLVEEEDIAALEKVYALRQTTLEGKIKLDKEEIKLIDETKIIEIQRKITNIEDEIDELDLKFTELQPTRKRFELIPLIILTTVLGVGLFLFYSSCAYILFYLETVSMEAINTDGSPNIQIFEPNSLQLSWQAGGFFALIYSALFFVIPYAIGFVGYELASWKKYIGWALILGIDVLIALNVSRTIEKVSEMTGFSVSENIFHTEKIIEYVIILFLGLIPMIILVELTKRIINYFKARHKDERTMVKEMKKSQLTNKILQLENELDELNIERYTKNRDVIEHENEKEANAVEIEYLPKELQKRLYFLEEEKNSEIRYMEKKRDLYVNAVDNDSIRISLDALKDRVNIYLDGWNKWLHEEFSRKVAIEQSKEARIVCDDWMESNLNNSEDKNKEESKI